MTDENSTTLPERTTQWLSAVVKFFWVLCDLFICGSRSDNYEFEQFEGLVRTRNLACACYALSGPSRITRWVVRNIHQHEFDWTAQRLLFDQMGTDIKIHAYDKSGSLIYSSDWGRTRMLKFYPAKGDSCTTTLCRSFLDRQNKINARIIAEHRWCSP